MSNSTLIIKFRERVPISLIGRHETSRLLLVGAYAFVLPFAISWGVVGILQDLE